MFTSGSAGLDSCRSGVMNDDGLVPSCLLLAGSLFFPLVYNTTKLALVKYGSHKLTNGDIYLISEKVTCSVQAVMAFSVGLIIVSQVEDIMKDTHWLTNLYAWFALPYFVHDTWAIYQTFYWNSSQTHCGVHVPSAWSRLSSFLQHRALMLVHHLILPLLLFPVVVSWRGDLGDFFVGTWYMIEIPVPFLSLMHVLRQLQKRDTRLYFLNGLCTLATFFCSRILVVPYLYWRYSAHAGISLLHVLVSIPVKCNMGCLVLLLPQLHWFSLLLRHGTQYFRRKS